MLSSGKIGFTLNGGGGGGGGARVRSGGVSKPKQQKLTRMFDRLRTVKSTVVPSSSRVSKTAAASATTEARRCPTWQHYQRVFDKVDNLKIQLPEFGSERMSDQFFKLLDPLPLYDNDGGGSSDDDDGDNDRDDRRVVEEFAVDEEKEEKEEEEEIVVETTSRSSTISTTGSHRSNDSSNGNLRFYSLSFAELVARFVLRAAVSPFEIDVDYPTSSDDNAITFADAAPFVAHVHVGLDSYLERAQNLFGRNNAATMIQLRQVAAFRIESQQGGFVVPAKNRRLSSKNASSSDSRQQQHHHHQDVYRKFVAICANENIGVARPFCGCCVSAVRLVIFDTVTTVSDSDATVASTFVKFRQARGTNVVQYVRNTQQTHVLFNVADILYHSILAAEFTVNFDICEVYKKLRGDRDQSRCSLRKTKAVQQMSFYRRVVAIHAAVYALVNWLWYRQAARHMDFSRDDASLDVPPILLTVNKTLAQLFTRVNTTFMQLLLQRQRLFFEFV